MRRGHFLVMMLSFCLYQTAGAQNIGQLLGAELEDVERYMEGYIDPFMTGFSYGTANGWYNTAKTHRLGGFDLTMTSSLAFVPDEDLFFDFEGFSSLSLADGSTRLPTIFGPRATTDLSYSTVTQATFEDPDPASSTFGQMITRDETVEGVFTAPDGLDIKREIGYSFVPVPMVQLGVGLIRNSELKIRFMPSISTSDFKFQFYGIGLMHDFKQWTPGISHLPFDAAVFVGWNRLTAEAKFDDFDEAVAGGRREVAGYVINSLTAQVIVSKKLSIFTVYGGFGYSHSNSTVEVTGDYQFIGESQITLDNGSVSTVDAGYEVADPIDIDFETSGLRATVGGRIQLLFLTIHLDYTFQEYRTVTAGVGFTFR